MAKILVYGIGNPFRCDDRAGIEAAEKIAEIIDDPHVDVKSGSIDGMQILDEITGYDRVFFIDSVKTETGKPGDIYRIKPLTGRHTPPPVSHGIDFITALDYGKKFGLNVPKQIEIFAIEIEDNTSFREECTEKVKASIPKVVEAIIREIKASPPHPGAGR